MIEEYGIGCSAVVVSDTRGLHGDSLEEHFLIRKTDEVEPLFDSTSQASAVFVNVAE